MPRRGGAASVERDTYCQRSDGISELTASSERVAKFKTLKDRFTGYFLYFSYSLHLFSEPSSRPEVDRVSLVSKVDDFKVHDMKSQFEVQLRAFGSSHVPPRVASYVTSRFRRAVTPELPAPLKSSLPYQPRHSEHMVIMYPNGLETPRLQAAQTMPA